MLRRTVAVIFLFFVLGQLPHTTAAPIESELCEGYASSGNYLLTHPQKIYSFSSELHIICKHLENWYQNSIIKVAEGSRLTSIYQPPTSENMKSEIREFMRQAEHSLLNQGDKFVFYQFLVNYYNKYLYCKNKDQSSLVPCLKSGVEVMNYRALIQLTRPDNNYGTVYRDFVRLYKHTPTNECENML